MAHNEGFLKMVNASKARIQECQIADVVAWRNAGEEFVLVDTREDSEWQKGSIEGAVHLGKGVIERDVEKQYPDKNTKLVLYCGGGFRSALAADALQQMGYTNVWSMDGGIRGWREQNLPEQAG